MFIAVRPPEPVLDALTAFIEPRRDADELVAWIKPDQAHLTLAFLPKVAETDVEKLARALRGVSRHTAPFTLALDGAGAFPDVTRARDLHQRATTGTIDIGCLAARVRTAIQRSGLTHDPRRFAAHLTVARVRKPHDVTQWWRVVDTFLLPPFVVDSFGLYSSVLHQSGAEHTLIESFTLSGYPAD